ncbi:11290_t:CDS:2 [Dentiscutata erythropus]|uniref:11290_t:CDS:1 n=1 Tax=Dentiscutata erythropus TaxID=1348616 RepID=A0A9N8V5C6_9GLOM|nr:11290_t:CDS:2 [Dentiscutata erythropus]
MNHTHLNAIFVSIVANRLQKSSLPISCCNPVSHPVGAPAAHCGAGCWVLDLGHNFPNSTFIEHNILSEVLFPDETFDYVHMSTMWPALTKQQYINVIHELENGLDSTIFLEISKCLKSINELTNIEDKKLSISMAVKQEDMQNFESATYVPDYMGIPKRLSKIN